MKKICIIVDHPSRDLVGITYLAQKIITNNYEIILVPMYHWHEIFLIRPDVVILNHGRTSEIQSSGINLILEYCKNISIHCLVLDNEGGIVDENVYKKILRDFPYKHNYLLWGKDKKKLIKKKNFIVSGHPRYDLYKDVNYNSKFVNKITNKIGKNYILINTSFPGSNPITRIHWDAKIIDKSIHKNILKYLEIEKINFHFFMKCLGEILLKYKKEKFILRPHPFENVKFYKEKFGNLKNVKISNKSDVYYYIRNCKFVINSNCQTSIEASLMEKNFINISTKYFEKRSKIIHSLKKPFYSLREINNEINKNLKYKKKVNYNHNKLSQMINNLNESSYPIIKRIILKSNYKPSKQNTFVILKIIFKVRGFIGCIKFLFKLLFKIEDIFKLKSVYGKEVYRKKYFNEKIVREHLNINDKNKFKVKLISSDDLNNKLSKNLSSIKISK